MPSSDTHRTIEALWREEMPRIVGGLMRVVRDLDLAEELAQDALVAALETWPRSGVPDAPGAWLMTTARRRGIDRLRHSRMADARHAELARLMEQAQREADARAQDALDLAIDDDVLRLVFVACHPVLPDEARVALTLRLVGGLTTAEIARAYLVPEATVAQRIVRAKRALAQRGVPFEVPPRDALQSRLQAVLQVLYLIFNEGYAASSGETWARHDLCTEAMRLAGVLAALLPQAPEVHGLRALIALQASRLPARTGADGQPVLLPEQDRARWDRALIAAGLASLDRARAARGRAPAGAYELQAAIAACHATAPAAADTDWPRIAALYTRLLARTGSPVVALNRAVAVGMAEGPAAALPLVETLAGDAALADYHLLPAVRGDLLAKLGRDDEAGRAYAGAADLAPTARERDWLLARAAACRAAPSSPG
ncbi:RNA polymerase sigma factor [Luteimonas deserti]|uniref:Sigma-70 family RNA polymerase sigma factor n=1 Tax=Luteimonas deserti TaxID=2752306 RepID=A0A7Z0QQK3_9GAMM|nr:sigma-70 family RNA polymerase sigma factor [Luteimonas deserti]NYZ61982.1 sigma-70 family RNA polymerase sigma factor [Luteimonas deserti]